MKISLIIQSIDRIDKPFNGSQMSKLTSKDSSRDIADSDTDKDSSKNGGDERPEEPPPILKYIKTQVQLLLFCF